MIDSAARAFSFGGGGQSTAALVLAARRELPPQVFLFSNVGDDSERPETLAYYEKYHKPYAKAHGIELIEVRRQRRPTSPPTLLQHLVRSEKSIGIPIRMEGSGAPGQRQCTTDWKIKVIAKWLRDNGLASKESPAIVGLGITKDEYQRAKTEFDPRIPEILRNYPLLEMGLFRDNCDAIVAEAGLPPVPKSACWFCPLHTVAAWQEMAEKQPEQFEAAAALEERLSERGDRLGRGKVFMSSRMKPLRQAIKATGQMDLFDGCDGGFCWT